MQKLSKEIEIELEAKDILSLTEQYTPDEICDVLLHHKKYRPNQSKMVFGRIVSDFQEEASELMSVFLKSDYVLDLNFNENFKTDLSERFYSFITQQF